MLKNIPNFFKPTKKKVIILCVIIALGISAFVTVNQINKSKEASASVKGNLVAVTRGDVNLTITGSGAVQPYQSYNIIPPTSGDIVSAPYEVGEQVEKDQILYTFDTKDAQINLQKQKNSLESSTIAYNDALLNNENLTITAPCDGVLLNMNFKTGDDVSNNAVIGNVVDNKKLQVDLPFNDAQIKNIYLGQTATISSSSHMSNVVGSVVHIDSAPTAQADGSMLYNVTVNFTNPGSLTKGALVGGEINGIVSPGSGSVKYYNEKSINTKTSGTIAKVYHVSGDYVKSGDTIVTLTNDTVSNSTKKSIIEYENAKLTYQQTQQQLEDNYTVKAPISGTVITKTSKAGDSIDKTNSTVTMMVVADVSKLKFDLNIDELDISKVKVGQKVDITSDAIANSKFVGIIEELAMQGVTTNGVTTYTASVVISEPGQLRPSMNVDASIIVESAKNVLRVPTSDVKTVGGKSYVVIKDNGASNATSEDNKKKASDVNKTEGENKKRGTSSANTNAVPTASGAPKTASGSGSGKSSKSKMPTAPEGYKVVEIQVGIKGDEYTEAKSGLTENDQIFEQIITTSSNTVNNNMMGGVMGGGASSGNYQRPSSSYTGGGYTGGTSTRTTTQNKGN